MRKRSKYRPKIVLRDPVAYAIESVTKLAQHESAIVLRIKNHDAIANLMLGKGTKQDFDTLVSAFNITEALAKYRLGDDWKEEIQLAQDAMYNMGKRAVKNDYRFIFTGPEMNAVRLGMDIHDAQLDACTIGELEKAIAYVHECIRNKKARAVLENKNE